MTATTVHDTGLPPVAEDVLRTLWETDTLDVVAEPLTGGMTNRNWKVTRRDGQRCVVQVQLPDAAAALLGIDRTRQQRAHDYAARAGVAPAILIRRPEAGVLVCTWEDGHPLPGPGQRSMPLVAAIGRALAVFHRGPCDEQLRCASADPFAGTWILRHAARAVAPAQTADFDFAMEVLDRIAGIRGGYTSTLTHGDMLPGNVLCRGDDVRLIDFEYAAAGDPLYDLGDLAGKNTFDRSEITALLRGYRQDPSSEAHDVRLVSLYRFVSLMREGLWALAASDSASVDFDYLAYARSLIARLTSMLDEPGFRRDLLHPAS